MLIPSLAAEANRILAERTWCFSVNRRCRIPRKDADEVVRIAIGIKRGSLGHIDHSLSLMQAVPRDEFLILGAGESPNCAGEAAMWKRFQCPGPYIPVTAWTFSPRPSMESK